MLHRTHWSLLLIWKARFRVSTHPQPPLPPHTMSKGALTIPGFTFTNFVAGSSGQIGCAWLFTVCVGMLLYKLLGLRAASCERFFFSLNVGGQGGVCVTEYHRPDTMKQNVLQCLSAVCCTVYPSCSNWVGANCCIWSVALGFCFLSTTCANLFGKLCSKSDDGSCLTFTLV